MDHLFEHWVGVIERINESRHIALFLDYDGTLTPIVGTPDKAHLSSEMRKLLERLSSLPWVELYVISGRALPEIKELVGIDGITYVGNHGLEMDGHELPYDVRRTQKAIGEILERLKEEVSTRGLTIEEKGPTASVHYRMVEESKVGKIKNTLAEIASSYVDEGLVKITEGKKVFELRPDVDWNKGEAVEYLLEGLEGALPFYVGDDTTDADAFRVLRTGGITVMVSEDLDYGAEYYLRDTEEVWELLERLISLD